MKVQWGTGWSIEQGPREYLTMIKTTIPTTYLSVSTNADGKRVWCAIHKASPLCPSQEDRFNAEQLCRETLRQTGHGDETPMVWDGDVGEFNRLHQG